MCLYQAFNFRMQLISIFQRLSRIYRSLKRLKVKHLTESTLCLKYFRNIVFVMTKGKNKKMKTTKIYLFLLQPLPSQDGEGLLQPPPPTFFTAKIFENFSHRYMGIWTKGR